MQKLLHNRLFILSMTMAFLVALAVSNVACRAEPETLSVFAAAGSKPALDAAAAAYDSGGTILDISYGGGGEVLNQMVLSRQGDIYVAPEQSFMERAVELEVIDPTTIRTIAWMLPVIAVAKGNPLGISTLDDLAGPGVRIGVTRPETTLMGRYALEILGKAGLASAVADNIVTESTRPDNLVTSIVMDQLDAALVWDFYGTCFPDEIDIIYIPPEQLTGNGKLQVAISSWCSDVAAANRFMEFLTSPEGKVILNQAGYIVEENEVPACQP